jgi:hypothetical protein
MIRRRNKWVQILRDPHKSTLGSAPDDAPHHAELLQIVPVFSASKICVTAPKFLAH